MVSLKYSELSIPKSFIFRFFSSNVSAQKRLKRFEPERIIYVNILIKNAVVRNYSGYNPFEMSRCDNVYLAVINLISAYKAVCGLRCKGGTSGA